MKYIRQKDSNIPYSLHDSRIKEICFEGETLTFKLDRLFGYSDEGELVYRGNVSFTDVDLEECYVSVLDRTVAEGEFKGHRYNMKEYMQKFKDGEFEILTEGYHGYDKTFVGWIWREDSVVSGVISIWTKGDMIYDIEP